MSRLILTNLNLSQNQLLNAAFQNLGAAPSSPVAGQFYFDTSANRAFIWNAVAGAWQWKATDTDNFAGQLPAYYLARGNQTGTQLASTISNLQSTVITYTLDTFAAPVAALNLNSQRLTNVASPTTGGDAANKAYVDATAQGLSPKPTARAATAAALPSNTYSNGAAGVGATLTASGNGALTIDGYAVASGDVVLIKNEAATANNGLYTVTATGGVSTAWQLTRSVDMDAATEFGGALIPVENLGTANANSIWLCNVGNTITVGTTGIVLTQLNSPTALSSGNGVNISGGVASGVVVAGGGVLVGSSGFSLDATVGVRKYAAAFGDGSTLAYVITHNLNTQDVTVGIYSATTPFAEVEADVAHTTVNQVTLTFAAAPSAGQYRVVVHG